MPSAKAQIQGDGVQIICVGLMRTGVKTLRRALAGLGYSDFYDQEDIVSAHQLWDGVLKNNAGGDPFPEIFQGAQVVMGMPTFCFWEQILERYPNARVILTIRDEDDWWKSVQRAKALMDEELPGAPLKYGSTMRRVEKFLVPSYHKFCELLRFAWATTLGATALEGEHLNEVSTRSSYRRHNSYVKATLSRRKTADGQKQLLVYDVRDGWAPLCKFLDADVPENEFPSVMNVPYFPGASDKATADSGSSIDCGQELENLLLPESEFGTLMRTELRRGLLLGVIGLTLLVGVIFAV